MSLKNQVYLYSVNTDFFYNEKEKNIHGKLLRLYLLRKELKKDFKKNKIKKVNKIINKYKEKLVEELNHNKLTSTRILDSNCLKNKNIISLFESSLTRSLNLKTNELTTEIMVVNVFFFQIFEDLVKNGYFYENEKYIFLTASAGQIRRKKAVFIKESSYKKISKKLMCGLTIEDINKMGGANTNKYLAYLALNNSATDVWENFDIDKSIVVDDFETPVCGEVDYIDNLTYKITREKTDVLIPHMDGCGIMLENPTRMVRLPWIKGLMVYFPFDKFIQEKCVDGDCEVYDIYGKPHKILEEKIKYIFTKSQFKMYRYFSSWDHYKKQFKENQCEACYCNIEEEHIPEARINYQMLQTLSDMKDEEIDRIIKPTVSEIESIGNDYQITMRLLGATHYNKNPSYFQEALLIYPELFRDQYCRDILKQTKKSLVKQAKSGRLRINGKYFFLSPDIYAFCEWLFLEEQNPKGLLKNGEVYIRELQDGDELACLRSPHLYREWAIRYNKRNEELDKWFGKTKCIYTSCHDLISRYLMFDNDGDKSLVIKDRLLTKIAKRNMTNIVPLAYDLKKAQAEIITNDSLYNGMVRAFVTGNIGIYSNNISKIWNKNEISLESLNAIKWLVFENNACIDTAKTLWMPKRPKNVNEIIKSYTNEKVPNFFIYAKDKRGIPKNKKENNLSSQVEDCNDSVMNRISKKIPSSRIKFCKTISKFDYRMLMNLKYSFDLSVDNSIINSYNYWNARQGLFNEQNENKKDQDLFCYKEIRKKIVEENKEYDINFIVNTLIIVLYTIKPNSSKKTLWASFGDIILDNLKNNLDENTRVCKICGKRFTPIRKTQICCSKECGLQLDREQAVLRKVRTTKK